MAVVVEDVAGDGDEGAAAHVHAVAAIVARVVVKEIALDAHKARIGKGQRLPADVVVGIGREYTVGIAAALRIAGAGMRLPFLDEDIAVDAQRAHGASGPLLHLVVGDDDVAAELAANRLRDVRRVIGDAGRRGSLACRVEHADAVEVGGCLAVVLAGLRPSQVEVLDANVVAAHLEHGTALNLVGERREQQRSGA